ncbi:MAG: class I SAM-dependent methyltransferase [Maricaulaceae bacterium]
MSIDNISETSNANDWGNYWQGRAAHQAGAALIGVGVETDAHIANFWKASLEGIPKNARCLDLACGAGSVLRHMKGLGFKTLSGVDISQAAIENLKQEFSNVNGVIASADNTGLGPESFDLIASQYGFEYADAPKAGGEAARLLANGGTFIALAHKSSSAIETEVSELLSDAVAILKTDFIFHAKTLFSVDIQGGSDAEFEAALGNFAPAQDKLLAIARAKAGLAEHLYKGTQELYQKRHAYALPDVHGWLDGMMAEITAFIGRMESMKKAALTKADVDAIYQSMREGGLVTETPSVLKVANASGGEDEIGWILSAKKLAA